MKSIVDVAVAVLIWIVACVQLALWTLIIVVMSAVLKPDRTASIARFGAHMMLRMAGIRLRVHGIENVPGAGQVIYMGNHVNFIDPFILRAAFPGTIVALEKASHFQWPVYGTLIRTLGHIPVYTDRPASARATIKQARAALDAGISLAIFPEGTRTHTGDLGPFHKGAFMIARQAGADIVPFTTLGSYALNKRGSMMIRPGVIDMVIRPPLRVADWSGCSVDELMEATRMAIAGPG